jgi:hypothetical protein
LKIAQIMGDDGLCATGQGKLNQMVVALVRQIWTPTVIHRLSAAVVPRHWCPRLSWRVTRFEFALDRRLGVCITEPLAFRLEQTTGHL